MEDTTSAILEFENGVIGTWVVCRAAPGKVDRTNVIYGSEGAAFWGEGIYDCNQELVYPLNDLYQEFMETSPPRSRRFCSLRVARYARD